jgi:hypothetical protein
LFLLPWSIATYRGMHAKSNLIREIDALNGLAISRYHFRLPGLRNVEFGPIESVYFLGPQVNDRNLEILHRVPELRILALTNTHVTDQGLALLSELWNLNCLYIRTIDQVKLIGPQGAFLNTTPRISGKGLGSLSSLSNLQVISLIGPLTHDEDLQPLTQFEQLRLVDLKDTSVTDAGVAELKKALPNCMIRRR